MTLLLAIMEVHTILSWLLKELLACRSVIFRLLGVGTLETSIFGKNFLKSLINLNLEDVYQPTLRTSKPF